MKFIIIAIALCIAASASADVSHLNNEYLPPHSAGSAHHQHYEQHDQGHQSQISQAVIGGEASYAPAQEEAPAAPETHEAHATYYAPEVAAGPEESHYAASAAEEVQQYAPAEAEAAPAIVAAEETNYDLAGEQPAAAEAQYTYDNSISSVAYDGNSNAPAGASGYGSVAQDVVAQYVAQGTTHEQVHAQHGAHSSSGIETNYGSNGGYIY